MADQTIDQLVNAAPIAASLVPYSEGGATYCATMTQLLGAPAGIIGMWSGTVASIPAGWALCDGQSGRPDLRNKFVVGAGNLYAVNAGGGNKDAIVVAHTHTGTVASHTHSSVLTNVYGTAESSVAQNSFPASSCSRIDGCTIGNTGDVSSPAATISTDGSSGTNANLPPYYALCYIMKS